MSRRKKSNMNLRRDGEEEDAYSGMPEMPLMNGICSICEEVGAEDIVLLCDNEQCPNETHLYCIKPPLTAVPVGAWYCGACSFSGTSTLLSQYFMKHEKLYARLNPQTDAQYNNWLLYLELQNVPFDLWQPASVLNQTATASEFDSSDSSLVGSLVRIRIVGVQSETVLQSSSSPSAPTVSVTQKQELKQKQKQSNTPAAVYHCGRIIDRRYNSSLKKWEHLVQFKSGGDGRNLPVIVWVRLEEHACLVSGSVVWIQSEGFPWWPGQLYQSSGLHLSLRKYEEEEKMLSSSTSATHLNNCSSRSRSSNILSTALHNTSVPIYDPVEEILCYFFGDESYASLLRYENTTNSDTADGKHKRKTFKLVDEVKGEANSNSSEYDKTMLVPTKRIVPFREKKISLNKHARSSTATALACVELEEAESVMRAAAVAMNPSGSSESSSSNSSHEPPPLSPLLQQKEEMGVLIDGFTVQDLQLLTDATSLTLSDAAAIFTAISRSLAGSSSSGKTPDINQEMLNQFQQTFLALPRHSDVNLYKAFWSQVSFELHGGSNAICTRKACMNSAALGGEHTRASPNNCKLSRHGRNKVHVAGGASTSTLPSAIAAVNKITNSGASKCAICRRSIHSVPDLNPTSMNSFGSRSLVAASAASAAGSTATNKNVEEYASSLGRNVLPSCSLPDTCCEECSVRTTSLTAKEGGEDPFSAESEWARQEHTLIDAMYIAEELAAMSSMTTASTTGLMVGTPDCCTPAKVSVICAATEAKPTSVLAAAAAMDGDSDCASTATAVDTVVHIKTNRIQALARELIDIERGGVSISAFGGGSSDSSKKSPASAAGIEVIDIDSDSDQNTLEKGNESGKDDDSEGESEGESDTGSSKGDESFNNDNNNNSSPAILRLHTSGHDSFGSHMKHLYEEYLLQKRAIAAEERRAQRRAAAQEKRESAERFAQKRREERAKRKEEEEERRRLLGDDYDDDVDDAVTSCSSSGRSRSRTRRSIEILLEEANAAAAVTTPTTRSRRAGGDGIIRRRLLRSDQAGDLQPRRRSRSRSSRGGLEEEEEEVEEEEEEEAEEEDTADKVLLSDLDSSCWQGMVVEVLPAAARSRRSSGGSSGDRFSAERRQGKCLGRVIGRDSKTNMVTVRTLPSSAVEVSSPVAATAVNVASSSSSAISSATRGSSGAASSRSRRKKRRSSGSSSRATSDDDDDDDDDVGVGGLETSGGDVAAGGGNNVVTVQSVAPSLLCVVDSESANFIAFEQAEVWMLIGEERDQSVTDDYSAATDAAATAAAADDDDDDENTRSAVSGKLTSAVLSRKRKQGNSSSSSSDNNLPSNDKLSAVLLPPNPLPAVNSDAFLSNVWESLLSNQDLAGGAAESDALIGPDTFDSSEFLHCFDNDEEEMFQWEKRQRLELGLPPPEEAEKSSSSHGNPNVVITKLDAKSRPSAVLLIENAPEAEAELRARRRRVLLYKQKFPSFQVFTTTTTTTTTAGSSSSSTSDATIDRTREAGVAGVARVGAGAGAAGSVSTVQPNRKRGSLLTGGNFEQIVSAAANKRKTSLENTMRYGNQLQQLKQQQQQQQQSTTQNKRQNLPKDGTTTAFGEDVVFSLDCAGSVSPIVIESPPSSPSSSQKKKSSDSISHDTAAPTGSCSSSNGRGEEKFTKSAHGDRPAAVDPRKLRLLRKQQQQQQQDMEKESLRRQPSPLLPRGGTANGVIGLTNTSNTSTTSIDHHQRQEEKSSSDQSRTTRPFSRWEKQLPELQQQQQQQQQQQHLADSTSRKSRFEKVASSRHTAAAVIDLDGPSTSTATAATTTTTTTTTVGSEQTQKEPYIEASCRKSRFSARPTVVTEATPATLSAPIPAPAVSKSNIAPSLLIRPAPALNSPAATSSTSTTDAAKKKKRRASIKDIDSDEVEEGEEIEAPEVVAAVAAVAMHSTRAIRSTTASATTTTANTTTNTNISGSRTSAAVAPTLTIPAAPVAPALSVPGEERGGRSGGVETRTRYQRLEESSPRRNDRTRNSRFA